MTFFKVFHQSKKSKARIGVITTAHGKIHTPAFVPVATKGTLKTIPPRELKHIGVQVAFVNTFHLVSHPGADVVEKLGGIHQYTKLDIPLMSDSAGFQVFSLAQRRGEEIPVKKISEEGVVFRSPRDGREMLFTPELSMKYQEQIGADSIMAFDECVYYGASYEYSKQATERTHRWLERCVRAHKKQGQYLYGIIQGGTYKDLREESAKFVGEQDTPGIAIGGVAVGESKKEVRAQLRWVAPYLPENKPVHLLGIGQVDDILDAVRYGIDTFDCVEPTRLARNGLAYQWQRGKCARLSIAQAKYLKTRSPIQKGCQCYTCQNFSLSFLHHLFKERELLGYYLATWHNLHFFAEFFRELRERIERNKI